MTIIVFGILLGFIGILIGCVAILIIDVIACLRCLQKILDNLLKVEKESK